MGENEEEDCCERAEPTSLHVSLCECERLKQQVGSLQANLEGIYESKAAAEEEVKRLQEMIASFEASQTTSPTSLNVAMPCSADDFSTPPYLDDSCNVVESPKHGVSYACLRASPKLSQSVGRPPPLPVLPSPPSTPCSLMRSPRDDDVVVCIEHSQ